MAKDNIANKLRTILGIKANIKNAIIEKGVEVDSSTPFKNYADKIKEISGGGSGTFILNSNDNPLLNNVTCRATYYGDTTAKKMLNLTSQDYGFYEFFESVPYIFSFDCEKPVEIIDVVPAIRAAYPEFQAISIFPFKIYGSNSPLNENNFSYATLVAEKHTDGQWVSIEEQEHGFKYFAIGIGDNPSDFQDKQFNVKFLITVKEKAAGKEEEKFVLNAVMCGSEEGSYPLSNASDNNFESWWSHDNGSGAEPYIAFQIPELEIAREDRVRILASFYNAWGEYPTSLTVKAVSQDDMAMVQAGIYGLDSVGTTLAQIDRDLPCDMNLTKLTDYIEYRQVKDMLIVFKANSVNSGSFKVAEARIGVEPKEE